MAVGHAAAQALTAKSPTVPARHIGARARLVDEDQPLRIQVELALEPGFAPPQDIGTVLLRCMA